MTGPAVDSLLDRVFERFFAELGELIATMPAGPPDMNAIGALYERFGLQVVGPPPSTEAS